MSHGQKFSLDNFKKWIKENHEEKEYQMEKPINCLIGKSVIPKISTSKLIDKITADTNNLEEMAIDFKESGGTIIEIDGQEIVIEVSTGCFKLNRCYVRKN